MFTGIVEETGKVVSLDQDGTNLNICIESAISDQLRVDQSVSHDGVCLTTTRVEGNRHWVTAIKETIDRSNFAFLMEGDQINLERCMKADGRFDGHIVQGHVDTTARVKSIEENDGSWTFTFEFEVSKHLVVEKGSICVNGISLTCFGITDTSFQVAIIPYTFEHTDFNQLEPGDTVNIEFDILGKYIQKMMDKRA